MHIIYAGLIGAAAGFAFRGAIHNELAALEARIKSYIDTIKAKL